MGAWTRDRVPTRAQIERNRFLKPVAHRILAPSLWRFTRRSVPRGVALGILAGTLCPVAHMPLAATLAFPLRANVPTAVMVTLLNNPLTVPPLWYGAYHIGRIVLRWDAVVPGQPIAHQAAAGWLHWLIAQGGPATMVGLIVIAIVLATVGYVAAALGWRWWVVRKWRARGRG